MLEMHAFVTGMVQGVGFRATVHRYAEEHGLKGFVSNLPDERVEFLVQGAKEKIENFLEKLKSSPGLGRIDEIEISWGKPSRLFNAFDIIP